MQAFSQDSPLSTQPSAGKHGHTLFLRGQRNGSHFGIGMEQFDQFAVSGVARMPSAARQQLSVAGRPVGARSETYSFTIASQMDLP